MENHQAIALAQKSDMMKKHWSYQDASWKGKLLRFGAKTLWPTRLIRQSGLFDAEYYLANNPDVARASVNPLRHFLRHGGKEGRKPHPDFDAAYYLQMYPDVKYTEINPLLHYLLYGGFEGRKPNREFDAASYLEHNPDVKQSEMPHIPSEEIKLRAFLQTPDLLVFPDNAQPVLSIILALFNRAELTFQCLESIKAHGDVPYEIVIVDNASQDDTIRLLERLQHVTLIKNTENVGFLQACNQAVEYARGKYVLFLNNDTQLLSHSLLHLVETIESDPTIGAVGGKLIFPDGTLQEAGSIIWKDGSWTGYGRHDHPFKPEYSYRREVDYCSGALLLTPRRLFVELGKFDERYMPAYYEEADYCSAIWEKGYKVVYQPLAQIIHHEFASSQQSDTAIQLQRTNRERFRQKWSKRLKDQYEPRKENVVWAREYGRSKHTQRILFIDDRIPEPALGRGYPRSLDMLHALLEAGYQMTLFPLQISDRPEPLTQHLQQKGVEVLYNHQEIHLKLSLRSFLKSRLQYYDLILVSRPHNMKEVLLECEGLAHQPKIIYDCEALFVEREILYRALIGTPYDDSEKEALIRQEVEIAKHAHAAIVVSHHEKQLFEQHGVQYVHVVGFNLESQPTSALFEERQDILFIGTIHHSPSPNEDAILYFADKIYPEVVQRTGAQLFIVGTNTSKKVWNLRDEHIHVIGKVEDLGEYYQRCRVFLVPSRYAAGIPYKLYEASAYGVPAVVTPLIAKQVGWPENESILVGHGARDFAEKCVELYTNKELWETIRKHALNRVARECNPEVFKDNLRQVIENIPNRDKEL